MARHVESGHPGLVVTKGEAGIGKTRLLEWFRDDRTEAGWSSRMGRCTPLVGPSVAYGPWKAALGGEAAAVWAAGGRESPSLDQLGDAVLGVLARQQGESPVVVVLEDLQWADRSSLALLVYVMRGLPADTRVLVCVSAREEAAAGEDRYVDETFAELLPLDLTVSLPVGPLTAEETRELATILAGPGVGEQWIGSIVRRSGGNPYFVRELAAGEPGEELPPALREVLAVRLGRVGPQAGAVVEAVALADVPVPHRVLEWALAAGSGSLNEALRVAVRARLVEVRDGRYEIVHSLLRQAAVERLLPGEREQLHRRLAEAFTRSGPDEDRTAFLSLVAEHWAAAGEPEQAIEASVAAAAAAAADGAHPEAQRLYGRALGLALRAPQASRETSVGELRRRCAQEAYWAGDPDTAVMLVRELLADPDLPAAGQAELRLDLARALRAAGRPADAVATLEEAYQAVQDEPPRLVVARTHAAYAAVTMLKARHGQAVNVAEAALPLLDHVEDGDVTPVRSSLLNTLGVSVGLLGDVDRGLDLLHESLELASQTDSVEDLCRAYTNTAFVLENAGRFDDAATVSLTGLDSAREWGVEISFGGLMLCNALEALVCLGRWPEAEQLADSAVHRPFPTEVMAAVHHSAAQLALGRGRLAEAHRHLAAAEQAAASVAPRQFHAQLGEVRAEVALADGEPQTALQVVQETLRDYAARDEDTLARRLVVVGLRALAELAQRPAALRPLTTGDIDGQASQLWSYARAPLADDGTDTGEVPLQAAELGLCRLEYARLYGQDEPGSWERNAAAWSAIPRPAAAAYAGLRGAQAALRRGRPHRVRATHLLDGAQRHLAALGEPTLLGEQIEALRRQARLQPAPQPPPRRDGPAERAARLHLTQREIEVLPLLAAGRTNRLIARELFISEKTASVHVSHIIAKLQVTNRSEAADAARRLGLLPEPTD